MNIFIIVCAENFQSDESGTRDSTSFEIRNIDECSVSLKVLSLSLSLSRSLPLSNVSDAMSEYARQFARSGSPSSYPRNFTIQRLILVPGSRSEHVRLNSQRSNLDRSKARVESLLVSAPCSRSLDDPVYLFRSLKQRSTWDHPDPVLGCWLFQTSR